MPKQSKLTEFEKRFTKSKTSTVEKKQLRFTKGRKRFTTPSPTVQKTLNLLMEGHPASTIAKIRGTSRMAISKHIRKLKELGLLSKCENQLRFTNYTRGVSVKAHKILDLRSFALGYNLNEDFDLGTEKKIIRNGVERQVKFFEKHGIELEKSHGKRKTTLIIHSPNMKGDDPHKIEHKAIHIMECFIEKINNWHNININPSSWYVSRKPKYGHIYAKRFAEEQYRKYGYMKGDYWQIDDSDKTGGEAHTFGSDNTKRFMEMPKDIKKLEESIRNLETTVSYLSSGMERMSSSLNKLIKVPELPGSESI